MTEIDPALVPLGATRAWLATAETAGYRCQCTNDCGTGHPKTAGRCDKELSANTGVRLYAVPAAPGSPALIALCGGCLDRRSKAERKAAEAAASELADQAPSLFDPPTWPVPARAG